ncbi:MAG: hypothetical protein K2V38_09165, partial [Gemmataceae bacterium]|nr:hypothetical protein [Gemmataceae bacterium]
MLRIACALALLLAAAQLTRAADPAPPAGNWKLTVPVGNGDETTMLIGLSEKEGKWAAEYLGAADELRVKLTVTSVTVSGDAVRFTIGTKDREIVSFDGTLSKDKKKLNGSMAVVGGRLQLTTLYPTKLTKLDDPFALARETVAQTDDGPELFPAAFAVLGKAGEKKVPADEVRGIVERLNKAAATFGPRWERETNL